jgi:hypothetical protein
MNVKRWIMAGLAFLLLGVVGCADKNRVPSGILSREKMEDVMWDMVQADQYAALYLARDSTRISTKTETLRLYEQIFRLHEVSREEFRKSYQYYLDHPTLNQVLFDSLVSRGARLRTEAYSRPAPYHPPSSVAPTPPPIAPHSIPPYLHGQVRPSAHPPVLPLSHGPIPEPSHGRLQPSHRPLQPSTQHPTSILPSHPPAAPFKSPAGFDKSPAGKKDTTGKHS